MHLDLVTPLGVEAEAFSFPANDVPAFRTNTVASAVPNTYWSVTLRRESRRASGESRWWDMPMVSRVSRDGPGLPGRVVLSGDARDRR
jgi:hypothetical protein